MKKTKLLKRIATAVCAVALCLVTLGLPILSASSKTASADAVEYVEGVNELDKTPVLEDLGEEYVKKYASQTSGQIQLHSFQEYCYSGKPTVLNTKYGLYLYIYNPSRTEFEEKTSWENNTVNMATSYNTDGAPDRYDKLRLKNCGYTTGEYDKLFYKFRIIGLEDVVKNVQAMDEQYGYRRYDISEIELRVKGNTAGAHAYTIARTYTYKGYAEGCGSEEASTLVCEQSEMDVIKDLPVHQTVWRPEGNNGKSEYTQDSLHSVWFSVPNKYIEKYGEMYAVHAMWREAVLKPFLVTGNQEAYNAIEKYLGGHLPTQTTDGDYVWEHSEDLNYFYAGAYKEGDNLPLDNFTLLGKIFELLKAETACRDEYNMGFNIPLTWYENDTAWAMIQHIMLPKYSTPLSVNPLYLMFKSENAENSADGYRVSYEAMKEGLTQATTKFGGERVNGKYSEILFSEVKDWKKPNINRELNYKGELLSKTKVDQNFWEKFLGKDVEYSPGVIESQNIYAIHNVTATDLIGGAKDVANRLYISENDHSALMKDYATAQNEDKTLYLFRYEVSECFSQEATLFHKTDKGVWSNDEYYWKKVDTNAYFFSESVFLDFDVIDLTFKKGEVETVIPVVMSPIDIFPETTPPIDTTEDDPPWWKDLFPGIGGGSGGSQNGGENPWEKVKKILAYVMAGAAVLVVVVIVWVVVAKIRNGHIRSETYKNTRPRKRKRK